MAAELTVHDGARDTQFPGCYKGHGGGEDPIRRGAQDTQLT